ncbi:MAG: lytic transglycosylase domain-containing protein [Cytophagales bacterium]|nr:lytic transglycosylase domain-containing protein [Cytophagales bacterium]
MKFKRIITTCLAITSLIGCSIWAQSAAQDSVLLDMNAAFKKNDAKTIAKLLPKAKGHPLESWAAYWALKVRLNDVTQREVDAFFKRYPDSYAEDRLRADWLLQLGKSHDWIGFAANYPAYRMGDDKDIKCYANRDNAALLEKLWMSQKEIATGCGDMAQSLIAARQMPPIVQWRKTFNAKTKPDTTWDTAQRNWALGFEGRALAQNLDLSALTVFAQVSQPTDLSDDMLAWWARAALRTLDWPLVQRVISSMSAEGQQDPIWSSWLAYAQQSSQKRPPLTAPLAQPAQNPLPTAAKASEQSLAKAKANQGLQRALYAIKIGLRAEGVREWNYETNLVAYGRLGSMDDEERLAAAAIACEAEVWDRCINTSERTKAVVDWSQRFPTPHKDALLAETMRVGMDPAFVYGLIRQESRFVTDARSHVGAAGLMQLMPATARWTANRIGLTNFTGSQIHDITTNLTLGVAYLKYVLEENGGNPAYAAAAYNAGPMRVKAWRKAMAEDPAFKSSDEKLALAIWAENIPFSETRDYVKKVSANTNTYKQILAAPPLQ